jgi:16S rRNA (uracil1498-N3)-methyltransferase
VERDDRSAVATFFVDAPFVPSTTIALPDSAAHHARVKRLAPGDPVRLADGAGAIAVGQLTRLDRARAEVAIARLESVARPGAIHLRVPIGDRDRMLWLAEKATELGIATWQAVRFRRSMSVSPRGEGAAFAAKVRARMISALEQSGGAWLPEILPDVAIDLVTGDEPRNGTRVVLDGRGEPLLTVLGDARDGCVLVFGPEGGLEADERRRFIDAGWREASLGATTLRFETAGVAAVAVARAAEAR